MTYPPGSAGLSVIAKVRQQIIIGLKKENRIVILQLVPEARWDTLQPDLIRMNIDRTHPDSRHDDLI